MFLLLLACGPGADPKAEAPDSAPGADAPTWHQDVAPIFSRSCDGCHTPGGAGTPTWTSPEQVATIAPRIAEVVAEGSMPPWLAEGDCNTYTGDFSLTEAEIATVVAWADAGAPEGDATAAAPLPPAFEAASLDRVDVVLELPEPYQPSASPDDYRCFLQDWPAETDTWITGYEVQPDNEAIVHHVIAFLIAPGDVEAYRALDEADPGPGYACYGAPGPDIQSLINARWLGAWAPGSAATRMPEGTGMRVPAGSAVVAQVHYNTAQTQGGADRSRLAFQVEAERLAWADVQPWTEVSWVLGLGMEIPANTEGVTHTFEYEISEEEGGFLMHGGMLHMHRLGRSARLEIEHADGSVDCVVSQGRYDFNWQRSYHLAQPVAVQAGDTVRLRCTWDNPGDEDVAWGDGTGDEMCLAVTPLSDDLAAE